MDLTLFYWKHMTNKITQKVLKMAEHGLEKIIEKLQNIFFEYLLQET
jgi:hypothetical protein